MCQFASRLELNLSVMTGIKKHSDPARTYTVGVSIAAVLIFLIAIFHIWRFIFRKIRKCWNFPEEIDLEAFETEIPVQERKLSTFCIQQLEMVLQCDENFTRVDFKKKQVNKPSCSRSVSLNVGKSRAERKKSFKRSLRRPSNRSNEPLTFFAGYSHQHVNES